MRREGYRPALLMNATIRSSRRWTSSGSWRPLRRVLCRRRSSVTKHCSRRRSPARRFHVPHASETALEEFVACSAVFGHEDEHPGIRK